MKEAASALTSFALSSVSISTSTSSGSVATSNEDEEVPYLSARDPPIDLVPKDNDISMLSDYNNLLVRHIEFFYPAKSHLNYDNLSVSKNSTNMSDIRLGLRCLHCKMNSTHVTAAAFFPSAVSSIASGLGTIGSRHFGERDNMLLITYVTAIRSLNGLSHSVCRLGQVPQRRPRAGTSNDRDKKELQSSN